MNINFKKAHYFKAAGNDDLPYLSFMDFEESSYANSDLEQLKDLDTKFTEFEAFRSLVILNKEDHY